MNNIAQDLMESLKTGLLGMGIVMSALYFLSLILDLMRYIFYPHARQAKKNEVVGITPAKAEQEADPETKIVQHPSGAQDNSQLVAVITAALSEYMQKPITHIRIGSIRPIHKTTPQWGMAARYENVYNKL